MVTRTRSRGGDSSITGSGYWRYYDGSGGAENFYSGLIRSTDTMTDVVTPGFKKRSSSGSIIMNPMTSESRRIHQHGLTVEWVSQVHNRREGWKTLPFPIVMGGFPTMTPLSDSMALAAAVNSANAKVLPSNSLALVFMAEAGKTTRMLRTLGQTSLKFASAIVGASRSVTGRKSSRAEQRQRAQAIADGWFTVRYGILPTLYDLRGALRSLREVTYAFRETARGTSSVKDEVVGTLSAYWRGPIVSQYRYKRETVYRAGILWENKLDVASQLNAKLGLSLADLGPSVWELVPYSFVLDWAIDVGDWLRAISPKPGTTVLGAWTTTEATMSFEAEGATVNVTEPYWSGGGGGGYYSDSWIQKSRVLNANPTFPGYGAGLSFNRGLDVALWSLNRSKYVLTSTLRN